MPHMSAIIVIPSDTTEEQASDKVMDLMFPYADYFPSEPYDVPCWCDPAQRYGVETADKEVGEFWYLYQSFIRIPSEQRPKWRNHKPVVEWQRIAIQSAQSHPSHQVDPSCKNCKGKGVMETESNFSLVKFEGWDIDGGFDVIFNSPNVCQVHELPEEIDYEAIITPDGRWHQWDSVEQTWEEWEQEVRQLLLSFQRGYLAVRCHVNQ